MKKRLCALVYTTLLFTAPLYAKDITIGGLFPSTGSNAEYGAIFSSGANLAVEHVNAEKLLKDKLTIQYEDSQATPSQGVIGMNKLVNVHKVPFVMTGFTGVSKAIAPIGTRTQTVVVNGGGVGPDLAKLGDFFWNVIPLANYEVRTMVPYLVQVRKLPRIALIYIDDPMGQAILSELQENLPKVKGELVGKFAIQPTTQQFASIAANVRKSKPDAIYIASYGAQQAQIIKQLRDNGISQQIASYSGFDAPSVLNLPEAEGVLFTTQKIDLNMPGITQKFVTDYTKKHGKSPNFFVINYYNSVRVFATLAASLEKSGKEISGANLLAERQKISSFDLVGTKASFNKDGTMSMPIQVNTIKNQRGVLVQ